MTKKPLIIAEMSGNHNKSLEKAMLIVESAAQCRCDAIKLQTYKPESLTLNIGKVKGFYIEDEKSVWYGKTSYEIYQEAALPYEWHKPIFDKCHELGLICFSSPFDFEAVDLLETLNTPMYKIASAELVDIALLKYIAKTKKPVIMSLGMANLEEIYEAVETLSVGGCKDLTLLKCTTSYPASPDESNLLTLIDLKQRFPKCRIGLSDHTLGIGASIAAIALGAEVIEKHFTLSRAEGGVDSTFSMEPSEMKQLVIECNNAYKSLGKVSYELTESEKNSVEFRRSLFVVEDINEGEEITPKNVRSIRPSNGLHTRHFEEILGKKAKTTIKKGTPLIWEYIHKEQNNGI